MWVSNAGSAVNKDAEPTRRSSVPASNVRIGCKWSNGFGDAFVNSRGATVAWESSRKAACEKRREYYADDYMELMRTEWSDA